MWKLSIVKAEHKTMFVIKAKPLPEDLLEYEVQSLKQGLAGTCCPAKPSSCI